jgi:hypothetical protein
MYSATMQLIQWFMTSHTLSTSAMTSFLLLVARWEASELLSPASASRRHFMFAPETTHSTCGLRDCEMHLKHKQAQNTLGVRHTNGGSPAALRRMVGA